MKDIRCVIFDFGGTLAKHSSSPDLSSVLLSLEKYCGIISDNVFSSAVYESYVNALQQYKLTGAPALWSDIIRNAAGNLSINLPSLVGFETFLWQSYLDGEITEQTKRLLHSLAGKGYLLMLACNTRRPPALRRKTLINAGVSEFFFAEVISSELGVGKPDSAFYDIVLHHIFQQGCKPHHAIFIGDSLERDVLGPMRFGMHGLLIGHTEEGGVKSIPDLTCLSDILTGNDW
ncbi:HAD family hydrolase [Dickeya sp. CFBP 2040]|uniref:HAD family hydrolase n=1 Tax=Dickeya sp. CFBP 2040 TaxID=2718531 RepID=UPI001447F4B1|nr:HAD family hydrolase [Dickeya sp. CFBP 2040]